MNRDDILVVAVYFAFFCGLASCARPLVDSRHDNSLKATATTTAQAEAAEVATTVAKVDKRPKRVIHLRPDQTPWKIEEDAGESSSTVTSSSKSSSSKIDSRVDVTAREQGHTVVKPPWGWKRVLAAVFGIALLAGGVGLLIWRLVRPRLLG